MKENLDVERDYSAIISTLGETFIRKYTGNTYYQLVKFHEWPTERHLPKDNASKTKQQLNKKSGKFVKTAASSNIKITNQVTSGTNHPIEIRDGARKEENKMKMAVSRNPARKRENHSLRWSCH